jgi:hypothetical protein
MNEKLYIHEFVDIIGPNRASYMHHMAANFSPTAQKEREQRCFGVWGMVGSTGTWPTVVNLWEEDGLDGMASSFRYEFNHATLQDPKLAKWWKKAAEFRSGGNDRLLAPAPWTRTIDELCADKVTGEVYAHERVSVPPGRAAEFLDAVRDEAISAYDTFGWGLVGAWRTLMIDESECFVIWAIPSWEHWAALEKDRLTHPAMARWNERVTGWCRSFQRTLLVDAPLSPLRTHRQPSRSDQTDWIDTVE